MPDLIASDLWQQRTLVIPDLGVVRRPVNGALTVDIPQADWLVASGYAVLAEQLQPSAEGLLPPQLTDPQIEAVLKWLNGVESAQDVVAVNGISAKKADDLLAARPLTAETLTELTTKTQLAALKNHNQA